MTRRPTGIRKAPPIPWMTRHTVIMVTEAERAHSREPTEKNGDGTSRKVRREPSLSDIHPEAGIRTQTVSM